MAPDRMLTTVGLPAIVAAALLSAAPAAERTVAGRQDASARIDALMAQWIQAATPGAAVLALEKGRVLHEKGYGLADLTTREQITATTTFDIASASKPFTAMAVLQLIDRGLLKDGETLGQFFPEFSADARRITIRQLLNHTSGLTDYTLTWGESRPLRDGTPRTSANVVHFLAGQRLRFEPGLRWEYSNSNYVVLAEIVARVSGVPFPKYMHDRIFGPLGMTDSYVYEGPHAGVHAAGYTHQRRQIVAATRNAANLVYGDGQVNTSVADLAKWARAISTEALVPATRLREAWTPATTTDGTRVPYGFGWGLGRFREIDFVGHGGQTDGFAAQVTRFPEQDLTVVLLSNDEAFPAPFAVANRIANFYLAELRQPSQGSRQQPSPVELNAYVGKYSLYDLELTVRRDDRGLWLVPSGQTAVKLLAGAEDEFILDGTDGASSIRFGRNSRGQVTSLSLLDQNGTTLWRAGSGPTR